MAISAYFRHSGLTAEKYHEASRRLDAAGKGNPAGRVCHVVMDADGEIEVFDIWESQGALETWGAQWFVPVLIDLDVDVRPPAIHPVRNLIPSRPGRADDSAA